MPQKLLCVNGSQIRPFDILVRLIPEPVHSLLDDSNGSVSQGNPVVDYVTVIIITGVMGEQRVKLKICVPSLNSKIPKIDPEVAFPVAVACRLLTSSVDCGILFAEEISPETFLTELNKLTDFHETYYFEEE